MCDAVRGDECSISPQIGGAQTTVSGAGEAAVAAGMTVEAEVSSICVRTQGKRTLLESSGVVSETGPSTTPDRLVTSRMGKGRRTARAAPVFDERLRDDNVHLHKAKQHGRLGGHLKLNK